MRFCVAQPGRQTVRSSDDGTAKLYSRTLRKRAPTASQTDASVPHNFLLAHMPRRPRRTQCPRGTAVAVPCEAGRYSSSSSLPSRDGCNICTLGHWCSPGSEQPLACKAGRYGATTGQTDSDCSGRCLMGHFCQEASNTSTSGVCRECHPIGAKPSPKPNPSPTLHDSKHQNCARLPSNIAAIAERVSHLVLAAAGTYNDRRGGVNVDACRACPPGQDSTSGAYACTFCSEGHFRLTANSSATTCASCDVVRGVSCGRNTTTATFNLSQGYWRHSNQTRQTWRCKHLGDWSPCFGGVNAGHEGNGYCAEGYEGPRCELCSGPARSKYFDKLDMRCHDCERVTIQAAIVLGSLLLVLATFIGGTMVVLAKGSKTRVAVKLLRLIRRARRLWRRAGMRFKLKSAVGLYQCLAAIPGVYDVTVPAGLEHLTRFADSMII